MANKPKKMVLVGEPKVLNIKKTDDHAVGPAYGNITIELVFSGSWGKKISVIIENLSGLYALGSRDGIRRFVLIPSSILVIDRVIKERGIIPNVTINAIRAMIAKSLQNVVERLITSEKLNVHPKKMR